MIQYIMLEIKNLHYNIGLRNLLEGADLLVGDGQKVGLVGVNGCGKSTLFRLILGQITPDGGNIYLSSGSRIATVKQEFEDISLPLLDFVLNADTELKKLNDALSTETDAHKLSEIYDKLNNMNAAAAPARAAAILTGLGFTNEDISRPLSDFSGGWRVRAALAATLFTPADILLLDEPTNHLDLETTIWLENYLIKTEKTVLIISHDRHILNKVCDKIAHVRAGKINLYAGNYDDFENAFKVQIEQAQAAADKHEETVAHLQSFVDRFRYKATKAAQAQSRLKMIERMGDAPEVPTEDKAHFNFPSPEQLPPYLINIEEGVAGYDDNIVLSKLNVTVSQDDRIALVGANGNGKSTLAKVLSERLPLLSGKVLKSRKLRTAYFAQHQTEELDGERTAFAIMSDAMGFVPGVQVYTRLGSFGLEKSKADTLVKNLSGGEKARLMLAIITKDKPHMLILDEPTNHLDIVSRTALLSALKKYEGAVILITHDLHLVELVCDRLWLIADGVVKHFEGGAESYRQKIVNGTLSTTASKKKEVKQNKKKEEAELRAALYPIRKEITKLERVMENLTKQKAELEQKLIENFDSAMSIKLAQKTKELEISEEKWVELNAQIEELQN